MTIWTDPEHEEWTGLSERTKGFIYKLTDKEEITVRVTPDLRTPEKIKEQGKLPAGSFTHDVNILRLDAGQLLPTSLEKMEVVNPASVLSQRRFPAYIGVCVHEAGHANYTPNKRITSDPFLSEWLTVMEEIRCEGKMVTRFPHYDIYLKSSLIHVLNLHSFVSNREGKEMDEITRRYDIGRVATLSLGRAVVGVIEPEEVEAIETMTIDILGEDSLNALREIWAEFAELHKSDLKQMLKLAQDFQKIIDPDDILPTLRREAQQELQDAIKEMMDEAEQSPCGTPFPITVYTDEEIEQGGESDDDESGENPQDGPEGESGEGEGSSEGESGESPQDGTEGESGEGADEGKGSSESESSESEGSADGEASEDESAKGKGSADGESTENESDAKGESGEGSEGENSDAKESKNGSSDGNEGKESSDSDTEAKNGGSGDSATDENDSSDSKSSTNGSKDDSEKGENEKGDGEDSASDAEAGDDSDSKEDSDVGANTRLSRPDLSEIMREAVVKIAEISRNAQEEANEGGKVEHFPQPNPAKIKNDAKHRRAAEQAKNKVAGLKDREADFSNSAKIESSWAKHQREINAGKNPYDTRIMMQKAGPVDQARSRAIMVALKNAQYREVHKTTLDSTIPPGRFNVRQAMNRSSQISAGQEVTATPWKQTRRREIDNPPITLAVATDVSGSMGPWQQDVSSFTWAFSHAVKGLRGKAGALAWNVGSTALIQPNMVTPDIPVATSGGGSTGCPSAMLALDAMMDLSYGEGVRVLAVITDGFLSGFGMSNAPCPKTQGVINELHARGVKIMWFVTRSNGWIPSNTTATVLNKPEDFGKLVGGAVIEALSKA